MISATLPYSERYLGKDTRFAAHAPTYPICGIYNRLPAYEFKEFTGASVLLQAGELDDTTSQTPVGSWCNPSAARAPR